MELYLHLPTCLTMKFGLNVISSNVWKFHTDPLWGRKIQRIVKSDCYVIDQRDATSFSFINLFNSALYVSGNKFAHPQELFLTVYTAFGTMHRHCCRPVHCIKSCIQGVTGGMCETSGECSLRQTIPI